MNFLTGIVSIQPNQVDYMIFISVYNRDTKLKINSLRK